MLLRGQKAVGAHYGVTERAVRLWMDDPMFPQPSGDQYDTEKIDAWRKTRPKERDSDLSQANAALSLQLKQYRVQREKEAALRAQREREVYEGTLLPRRSWEGFAANILASLGDWCDQFPELIENQVPRKYRKQIRDWAEQQLSRMRDQMAEDLKRTPDDE